jgi:hypothetical protein
MSKRDAAESPPKLIPPESLQPRDNSGGLDYAPRPQRWRDGGRVHGGAKPHLSQGVPGGDAAA